MPRRAVRTLGGRSARAPQRALAGWPRLPRPAKTERLRGPADTAWRVAEARGQKDRGDWARQVRIEKLREGSGKTAGARRWMGVQRRVAACVRHANVRTETCGMCTETCSPPRVAAFGTAACWTVAWQRRCLDGPIGAHQAAVVSGCKRVPPARPPWAVLCSVAAVGVVSRNHQRRRAVWGCTSVAAAVASACGGKTSRPIHRTIAWGLSGGPMAGGWLGLRGAPRPGRPALSAQSR